MYIWNHRSFEWKGQNVDVVSSKKKTNKSSSTVSIDRSIGKYRDAISVRRLWREFSRFFFLPFFFFHFASRISMRKRRNFSFLALSLRNRGRRRLFPPFDPISPLYFSSLDSTDARFSFPRFFPTRENRDRRYCTRARIQKSIKKSR